MTRRFGESIHAGKINIDETEMDPSNLLKVWELNDRSRPRTSEHKDKQVQISNGPPRGQQLNKNED